MELFNILSFRLPVCWISDGSFADRIPSHIFSVSFEPKDWIILPDDDTNAKGNYFFHPAQP